MDRILASRSPGRCPRSVEQSGVRQNAGTNRYHGESDFNDRRARGKDEGCGRVRNARIVGDVSSVEVFVNDGSLVFSTRIYPESYGVIVDALGANVTYHALNI